MNIELDKKFKENPEKQGIKGLLGKELFESRLAFPLKVQDKIVGLVNIEKIDCSKLPLNPEAVLALVCRAFADALQNARAFQASRTDLAKVKALNLAYLQLD